MSAYEAVLENLRQQPRVWLVTGAAGFIGSSLVQALLDADQRVVGLDNFATGLRSNLADVRGRVGQERWQRFDFQEGDIRRPDDCRRACDGVSIVLHQAALGSVPRSIEDPLTSHDCNVTGTVQMALAAREAGVDRFVFASSSSVYGDDPGLPKIESRTGRPLSPYAVTKVAGERYMEAFHAAYGQSVLSLRYFNVFGARQDPAGPYAAVIPRWTAALLHDEPVMIFGDGETSRDFCYVANAVQANVLAGTTLEAAALAEAFNVAAGVRTTLKELFVQVKNRVAAHRPEVADVEPVFRDFRPGDVRHSLADVSKAGRLLGYDPTHSLADGLDEAMEWYVDAASL